MQFLTKEAIKAHKAPVKMVKVEIPEWEGYVFVREVTARGRDIFEDSTFEIDEKGKVRLRSMQSRRALLVVLSTCDENGDFVFDMDDIGWLGEKQYSAVERIYKAAQELNGMTAEKAEKNFETPAESSSSD